MSVALAVLAVAVAIGIVALVGLLWALARRAA